MSSLAEVALRLTIASYGQSDELIHTIHDTTGDPVAVSYVDTPNGRIIGVVIENGGGDDVAIGTLTPDMAEDLIDLLREMIDA